MRLRSNDDWKIETGAAPYEKFVFLRESVNFILSSWVFLERSR